MKTKGRRQSKNVLDLRKTSVKTDDVITRSADKLLSKTRMKDQKGSVVDKIRNKLTNPGRQQTRGPEGPVSKPTKFKARKQPRVKKKRG